MGNPPGGAGVILFLGEGFMGVVGVRGPETLNLDLLLFPAVVVVEDVGANEIRRCGIEFVERPSADIVSVLDTCDGGGGGVCGRP